MEVSEQEFLNIIKDNEQQIQHLCRTYLSREDERKDLYQEIIIQVWRSLPAFKGKAKLSTWIYRIGINTAISYIRKKKTRKDYHAAYKKEQQTSTKIDDTPYAIKNENEQVTELYRAISTLNTSEKAIISMYLEEFSYAEIACVMDITENYVGVKLNRIKKKLSKKLKGEYGT